MHDENNTNGGGTAAAKPALLLTGLLNCTWAFAMDLLPLAELAEDWVVQDMHGVIEGVQASQNVVKAHVVIIDSLVRGEAILGVKEENHPLRVEPQLESLRALIAQTSATILLVHHFRKAGDRMRGTSA